MHKFQERTKEDIEKLENCDKEKLLEFLIDVFHTFSLINYDICDELYWRTDGEYAPITLFVNVNDVFHWGCADSEDITPESLPEFKKALNDINEVAPKRVCSEYDAIVLYAARMRKMRPQGAAYPFDKEIWPLLNECGPEREVGLGNPHTPESYHQEKLDRIAENSKREKRTWLDRILKR